MSAPTLRLVARSYPITVHSGGEKESTTLLACWSEEDPAAVTLTVEDPWAKKEDDLVEWVVSRGLLVGGCLPQFRDIAVGIGDVTVRHNGDTAQIALRNTTGTCVLAMRGEVLTDFLRAVAKMMPLGSPEESEIYADQIDAEWAEIASAS